MNKQVEKQKLLDELYKPYANCQLCPLATQGRTNVVFGSGNPDAKLMIIGEAPGQTEDMKGLPFVGRSGALLDKIFTIIGFERKDIYISNVVKCRPPKNRAPTNEEISQCKKILLENQIKIIDPHVICTLGAIATNALLNTQLPMTNLRGTIQTYNNIPTLVTYHPAYILRQPKALPLLFQDLEKAYNLSLKKK